ncbi:hypothetical protein BRADI_3g44635v3 [Brachypodium distachyon]|uniref:Uncharacterized protein n=1 Tax=Brachypodium distachyon TaxID=15368 RepID=A0A2K2D378_BRADI|nr:hypothetical protein BRADI_3g44635v3 [Brachypodium distachyon]
MQQPHGTVQGAATRGAKLAKLAVLQQFGIPGALACLRKCGLGYSLAATTTCACTGDRQGHRLKAPAEKGPGRRVDLSSRRDGRVAHLQLQVLDEEEDASPWPGRMEMEFVPRPAQYWLGFYLLI